MRDATQLFAAGSHGTGHHLLFGGDIEQCILRLEPATGRNDVADQYVLGAQCLPVTEDDFAGAGRQADHVLARNRLVHAAVTQVVANDFGQVFRQHGTALPAKGYNGNRNGAVGATGNADVLLFRAGDTSQRQTT